MKSGTKAHFPVSILLLALFLIGSRSLAQDQQPRKRVLNSQSAYDQAFRLLSRGKTAEALADIEGALTEYPLNPSLHNLRGLAADQMGREKDAESSFRKVIELSPQAALGYNNLGTLLSKQGRHTEAEGLFRDGLKREPQSGAALMGLGVTLGALRRYSEAAVYLEKAWHLKPGDFQTGYELAHTLWELKRPLDAGKILEKTLPPQDSSIAAQYFLLSGVLAEDQSDPVRAASLYRRAYELAPASFDTYLALIRASLKAREPSSVQSLPAPPPGLSAEQHFTLGLLFASRGVFPEATPHFEATLRMEPASYSAAYNLALAYKGNGKTSAAIDLIEHTLTKRPTAELHHLLATLQEEAGRYVQAVEHFRQAVELEPANEQYYFDLGVEYLAHFTFAPAQEVFEVASRKFPEASRQYEGLGLVHYALRHYREAADAFLRALEINSSSSSAYAAWNVLHSFLSPTDLEQTLPRLQRLSQLNPENADLKFCYALALLARNLASNKTDDLERIESLLEGVIRIRPRFPDAHLALGNLYVARKEKQKAVNQFLETIRWDPQSEMAFYRLGQVYRDLDQIELARQQLARYAELVKSRREQMARSRTAIKQFVLAQSVSSRSQTQIK